MWIDEEEIAFNIYKYCMYIKDDPKIRKLITHEKYAYGYCIFVKDRPEVRKYITNKEWLKTLERIRKNEIPNRKL